MNIIMDIETDGLWQEATKLHVVSYAIQGQPIRSTTDRETIQSLVGDPNNTIIGHYFIESDKPTLEKFGYEVNAQIIDTIYLSYYLYPLRQWHGLASWGTEFGVAKPKIDDWEDLSLEEYTHRCEEDVKITAKLWLKQKAYLETLYPDGYDHLLDYLAFKSECMAEQAQIGWKINKENAEKGIATLTPLIEEKKEALSAVMPDVIVKKDKKRPAKPFKKDGSYSSVGAQWFSLLRERGLPRGYTGGVSVEVGSKPANPSSSSQVKDWLFSIGWKPCTFKTNAKGGQVPQVRVQGSDGKELAPSVRRLIEREPAVKELDDLTVLEHRVAGLKSLLENEVDGRVKAQSQGLTNTLRFKHTSPCVNMPGADKAHGEWLRGSLVADEGKVQCGADMASLEARTKWHYMWPHDPEYVKEMLAPDFDEHLDLALQAKACTLEEVAEYKAGFKTKLKPIRDLYKPANYSCVYGVGKVKLAATIGMSVKFAAGLIETYWKRNWAVKTIAEETEVIEIDGQMWLFNPVSKLWLSLRYMKDIFSTLNQSTGCYCFDMWVKEVRAMGYQVCGQFHDEIISQIDKGTEEKTRADFKKAIGKVNETLKLNIDLDVGIQFGRTYADIH